MIRAFDSYMRTGEAYFREQIRHKRGQNLVKSYLIEANIPDAADRQSSVQRFFRDAAANLPMELEPTEDVTLHSLSFQLGSDTAEFYLDTLDTRFWLLHTIEPANKSHRAVGRLVNRIRNLDAFWIPSRHLAEWTRELGATRQLSSKFNVRTGIYQESVDDDEFLRESLVLRTGSRENWDRLRRYDILASQTALWSVKLYRSVDGTEDYNVADLSANGKMTSRGVSFGLHQYMLEQIRSKYSNLITTWEETYWLGWRRENGVVRPSGQTAMISFPDELTFDNLANIVAFVANAQEPFRLFGTPIQRPDNRILVKALDLHSADRVDLEFTPTFVRAYLFQGSCGNVLARLITNLQHYVDARIELADVSG